MIRTIRWLVKAKSRGPVFFKYFHALHQLALKIMPFGIPLALRMDGQDGIYIANLQLSFKYNNKLRLICSN